MERIAPIPAPINPESFEAVVDVTALGGDLYGIGLWVEIVIGLIGNPNLPLAKGFVNDIVLGGDLYGIVILSVFGQIGNTLLKKWEGRISPSLTGPFLTIDLGPMIPLGMIPRGTWNPPFIKGCFLYGIILTPSIHQDYLIE